MTKIKVFTDGSAAQFKNRFLFANLWWYQTAYDLEHFEWNFFATSHGKGSVDGLGGALKRTVRNSVLSKKAIVENADDFALACKASKTSVTIIVVKPEEIVDNKQFLDKKWDNVLSLKGTQNVHHLVPCSAVQVRHSRVSTGLMVETHSFAKDPVHDQINNTVRKETETDVGGTANATGSAINAEILPGSFVLVDLPVAKKSKNRSYVAVVKTVDKEEIELQFLKRVASTENTFVLKPNDISWVESSRIVKLLACPSLNKRENYCFEENLHLVD